jgi:tetraacyldisaccharide 4'-kinase
VSLAQLARWAWGPGPLAAAARLPLVPLSMIYDAGMAARAAAYRSGLRRVRALPGPSVAVGNLGVGGAGKTPIAASIAQSFVDRGRIPGLLLRGYGGDEALVLKRLVPKAVVVASPNRLAGARDAVRQGADVFVLDDAFQLLGVARDLNIAVVSAEARRGWRLPAGPWREPWHALARAQVVIVTRKRATAEEASDLARQIARRWPQMLVAQARLAVIDFAGLDTGMLHPGDGLRGRRVVAAAGVYDPETFRAQLEALGAQVQLLAFEDHHRYPTRDVERLAQSGAEADYVVVTEKDAVKLRGRLRLAVGEPLVARLAVQWEEGRSALLDALAALDQRP